MYGDVARLMGAIAKRVVELTSQKGTRSFPTHFVPTSFFDSHTNQAHSFKRQKESTSDPLVTESLTKNPLPTDKQTR
jgi:hypothetical protein